MHRLPSVSTLRSFRIATVLLLLSVPTLLAAVTLGALVVFRPDLHLMPWFLGVIAAIPLLCIYYLVVSHRARCPLCMNPPLSPRRCQKHRNAVPLFGSHRLRVANGIFLRNRFICPHCGEATRLEVRERRRP